MSGLTFTDLSVGDNVWYIDNDGVSIIRVKVIIMDAKKTQVHLFKSFLNDCKFDLVIGENEVGSSDVNAPLPDKFDGSAPAIPPLLHKRPYSAMEYQPLVHIYSKRIRVAGDAACMHAGMAF